MRMLTIAAALILTTATLGVAAPLVFPPTPETLVEGHSVFTVVEAVGSFNETNLTERFAAAVAVLIREKREETRDDFTRFPGVLWFNDQYLVNPTGSRTHDDVLGPDSYRYPCGSIIIVNRGDPVVYDLVANVSVVPIDAEYVESYYVTPPSSAGGSWTTDKWMWQGRPMWSVTVGGGVGERNGDRPDDGEAQCGVSTFTKCGGAVLPFTDDTPQPGADPLYPGDPIDTIWHQDPTYNDSANEGRMRCGGYEGIGGPNFRAGDQQPTPYNYPCGTAQARCDEVMRYNAVAFLFIDDLTVAGPNKNHTDHSTDYDRDVSGCQANHPRYPCPETNGVQDDDREGNSHPYNPMSPFDPNRGQYPLGGIAEGRNNHGGSADCTGDNAADMYCHVTREIDIYFGYRQAILPAQRNYVVYDQEGGTAPYHCHEDIQYCNEEDRVSWL